MDIFTLDALLLIIMLPFLLWLRLTQPNHVFQIWCQFAATFWAQYSWVVSWSLGRMVPMLAATSIGKGKVPLVNLFVPFVLYTIIGSLIASLFWDIPAGVSPMYGEYRVWLQLFVFITSVFSARGLLSGLLHQKAPLLLWQVLTVAVAIHGIFSIYQFIAWWEGLPLIGMSRAHNQTVEDDVGDVAAFTTEEGDLDIPRPAGLAGEPKTAAVVFGIYLITFLASGLPQGISSLQKKCGIASVGICFIGYVLAFSTSAFIGGGIALVAVLALLQKGNSGIIRIIVFFALFLCLSFLLGQFLEMQGAAGLLGLLEKRTVGRMDQEIDPPIEAALWALANNSLILMFGTGLGGGSFPIMRYWNTTYDYSYAPNVGGVLLLLESGVIGATLLLLPFTLLLIKAVKGISIGTGQTISTWNIRFLCGLGLSAMCFMLTSSGIAMGYILSVACIVAAAQLAARRGQGQNAITS